MKTKYILKRINAFLIDYMLVGIINNVVIGIFFPFYDISMYTEELLDLSQADPTQANLDTMNSLVALVIKESLPVVLALVVSALFYYVIIAKALKNRTLGCLITGQVIMKSTDAAVSYSDLTLRMLLINGIIVQVTFIICYLLLNNALVASTIYFMFFIGYAIFIITNFIVLIKTSKSLVDIITKTRPLIVMKVKN